jgi:hypothetical protein
MSTLNFLSSKHLTNKIAVYHMSPKNEHSAARPFAKEERFNNGSGIRHTKDLQA